MSLGARLAIAVICIAAGIGFACAAMAYPVPHARWLLWAFAAVCFICVACCFEGTHRPVTNRIVGAVVFLLYVAYLIDEIREGKWFSTSRAVPSVLNAIKGLIFWGLPAAYVMIHGRLVNNPFKTYTYEGEENTTEPEDENRRYLRR